MVAVLFVPLLLLAVIFYSSEEFSVVNYPCDADLVSPLLYDDDQVVTILYDISSNGQHLSEFREMVLVAEDGTVTPTKLEHTFSLAADPSSYYCIDQNHHCLYQINKETMEQTTLLSFDPSTPYGDCIHYTEGCLYWLNYVDRHTQLIKYDLKEKTQRILPVGNTQDALKDFRLVDQHMVMVDRNAFDFSISALNVMTGEMGKTVTIAQQIPSRCVTDGKLFAWVDAAHKDTAYWTKNGKDFIPIIEDVYDLAILKNRYIVLLFETRNMAVYDTRTQKFVFENDPNIKYQFLVVNADGTKAALSYFSPLESNNGIAILS